MWEVPRPHHALGSCNAHLLWLFTLRGNDSPVGLSLRPSGTPYFWRRQGGQYHQPHLVEDSLKASKTDPFRNGIDIVVGRTNNKLCPVTAVMAACGNGPGFPFKFQDRRHLTKPRFVEAVRQALGRAGFDPKAYTGHSFRIVAAATANACGLNDSTIQMLGRWSSSAYLVYVRTPREQLATYSSVLGQDLS